MRLKEQDFEVQGLPLSLAVENQDLAEFCNSEVMARGRPVNDLFINVIPFVLRVGLESVSVSKCERDEANYEMRATRYEAQRAGVLF